MMTVFRKSRNRGLWLLSLLLLLTPVWALAGTNPPLEIPVVLSGDYQVGNLNAPGSAPVPGIFMGEEEYAYHILPAEQSDCSEDGFILESITQLLFFEENQVPVTLMVQAALLKADFDPSSDCWVPGPVLYDSPQEIIMITDNGPATIKVLTPGIPVFPLEEHYFLVLRYQGGSEALLVVDDQPMACTEFINRGNGWEDLYGRDKSGGGKVIVFGDIVCAPMAVPTVENNWDRIKSLYK